MRKILLIITFILTNGNLFAQKLYVWCPKEQIATPRQGFLEKDTIDLVVFDGRILTPKLKVECSSEETINKFTDFIRRTYPSATINILNSNQYYKDPAKIELLSKLEFQHTTQHLELT
ncbi:hypothetical protein FYC62_00680 [Pedobacter aquae]|uniref:Uncharacterized protein n=1 Tax=Pedobacter aquae TaxID=2605747 RepID=A0A5C0VC59_9SPHI|nr:hypothetical protein [Pedobacter aquae]QEK50345.1 hypothetical protein FYC62_00680 [Pedobacter aquae]